MAAPIFARGKWGVFVAVTLGLVWPGCGDGLFTRGRAPSSPSASPDAALDGNDDTSAPAITNMNVKAGASAIGQLGGSTLTVPSMSFDQDVTLILKAADLRLATYKDKSPTGLWVALPGQVYDATAQTLAGDFFNLDQGPIFFGILKACTDRSTCAALQTCSARLCQ